jgi:hypothetical protein
VTDEEIYRSLTAKPESAAAVERLRGQMAGGDSYGVKEAVEGLLDFATHREVAAVKRYLKAGGTEGSVTR